jgi:ParB family chromosome partitioning protein
VQQAAQFQMLPIGKLKEHPLNPRKDFDEPALAELEASVRQNGVIVPLLVRKNGHGYEIIGGARRYRAAKRAELTELPVVIRDVDDQAVMELMILENLQRANLSPLEEAQGYAVLMTQHGYTAERIAERIGMSLKYVYDRVKLTQMVPVAQELLVAGRITAGHAILLARLKPADQNRAIDTNDTTALFQHENELWDPYDPNLPEKDHYAGMKARSVRELQAWIDDNVRFEAKAAAVDPMLFPHAYLDLKAAESQDRKVIMITHEHYVQPEARDPQARTFGPRSWKRADGEHRSKKCEHSITGVVVVGPRRGESLQVCIAREKCRTHWGKEIREKAERAKAAEAAPATKAKPKEDSWEKRNRIEQEKRQREIEKYKRIQGPLLRAISEKVQTAATHGNTPLGRLIVGGLLDRAARGGAIAKYEKMQPIGKTAEDLVRFCATIVILDTHNDGWAGPRELPEIARALGVDVAAIEKQHAAVQTSAKPKGKKK